MKTSILPISRKNKLAGTPKGEPRFSSPVKTCSGEPLNLADPKATRALVALMDMNAVLGGAACHWGGPSAFAELMSALHGLMFAESRREGKPWHELFSFVNDGGHCENGLYALKANCGFGDMTLEELKGFRSMTSRLTGHGESHLFPEGVLLSNGPLGSALPQAQGLAFADGLSGSNRITVTAITDGACMEGEARESLAAIPGLAARGRMAPFLLIVSDNNTKLTGRIDQESFSMAPTFASLKTLGWDVIELHEAHSLQACFTTLESAVKKLRQNPERPVAIHAHTIKGVGVKKTAESASGGHGYPLKSPSELPAFLKEIYGDQAIPSEFLAWVSELEQSVAKKASSAAEKTEAKPADVKVQAGVSEALIRKAKEGLPVISISSDLPGSTGLLEFQKAYPAHTQDVGVAESNMISMAAGLARQGFIPVVDTFAQFGVTKGALPLTMAALSQAPVIAIFSHVGFQDAADGASHQALTYFSMVSSIPHTQVVALTCREEANELVGQAVDEFAACLRTGETPPTYVFFLGRENFPPSYGVKSYKIGQAQLVRYADKPDVVIAAAGASLGQALLAAELLNKEGLSATVINPSTINHPDVEVFRRELKKCGGRLLTVEDHQAIGGMGSLLTHALLQAQVPLKAKSLGVHGDFGQSAYNAIELYKKHGLDSEAIAKAAKQLMGEG